MRVALDISPTITGHKVRGIGAYTQRLKEEFQTRDWGVEFDFFENPKSPPPADVIHYPYFDLFFHTLPTKSRTKRVVTIHDVIPLVFPQYFPAGLRGYINLFFQKRALKNVQAVICDSETSKNDITARLSFPAEKIQVIYLAAAPKFQKKDSKGELEMVFKKYHLPKKFGLYVGDVNWNKNIPGLLESIKISKVNLVMVGSAHVDKSLSQTREIDKAIKKLAIGKRVTKTGFVDDDELVAIYNLATLTILPSFYEGFGLPVLESMACGTLVVCSKVASLSEIAGKVAIFCDPASPEDIAQKIDYVFNLSQKAREDFSSQCIDHASRFNWQKVAQETIEIYKSVAKLE